MSLPFTALWLSRTVTCAHAKSGAAMPAVTTLASAMFKLSGLVPLAARSRESASLPSLASVSTRLGVRVSGDWD